jgi:adenylate kinase family enzyme
MNLTRTLIIGNSGSGKSWLAQRSPSNLRVPWVDLDSIHWLCDEHSIARPRAEALGMARIAADEPRWVIEGVYGWIVSEVIHRATALIWLSVEDDVCVANIRQRETNDDERLIALLEWAG